MTETVAILKNARVSPQKARLVANQIRNLSVAKATEILNFSVKKAAKLVRKALDSAIANAEHNHGADIDELKVSAIYVDEARVLKRMHARARGRGARILKRSSHITIKVSEK